MRAILFDMDGVLYNSEDPIPGAAETLAWLRERQVPHLFVTNTTSRGCDALTDNDAIRNSGDCRRHHDAVRGCGGLAGLTERR